MRILGKPAAASGWIDGAVVAVEIPGSIERSGADMIPNDPAGEVAEPLSRR